MSSSPRGERQTIDPRRSADEQGYASAEEMTALIEDRFRTGLSETVAWFEGQMADYYYRATSRAERVRHIEFIHAMRRMPNPGLTMVDDAEAGKILVFGPPASSTFGEALRLLGDHDFSRVEIHTTRDRSLALFAFAYRDDRVRRNFDREAQVQAVLDAACTGDDCVPRHLAQRYLEAVGDAYLSRSSPERVARHLRAWLAVEDPEHVHVVTDEFLSEGKKVARILVAARMGRGQYAQLLARFLHRNRLYLERGYLDEVPAHGGDHHLLISTIYVTEDDGSPVSARRRKLIGGELTGIRRHFDGEIGELYDHCELHQREFELMVAAIDFAAQLLHTEHRFLDVREAGRDAIRQHPELCRAMAELVEMRFGPKPLSPRWWQKRHDELLERIRQSENLAIATVLESMLAFFAHIRRTNVFRTQRLGQAFMLDPAVLSEEHFDRTPYGVTYFHGRSGVGFHVRFRASARGGLRLLLPRTHEQLGRYRNRLLSEAYDLAWAQQLKNKDIPEGGSKCIALVRPGGDADEMVRQLADSLIDLVLPPERIPEVRGPHGEEREDDLVFLGPDENMTPSRIQWVADRAAARGLPHPLTLMSSKPGSGINHKEYGVTSEGVCVWVERVRELLEIGDDHPWTVTMTGGPDGDVGGNLLKILRRDHNERCRVLAIADGSGSAYDPDGLDWDELLRLVEAGSAIAGFDAARLTGIGAHVTPISDRASEELRNNLHNRTRSDIFVPCGGRPYTINDRNWSDFLDPEGRPIARAMVEGANIFVTSEARRNLERNGLIVIKDSSANKGGVITSSYEILAGLVIDEAEFLAIKDEYVTGTIGILRTKAADEAEALIEAWHRRGKHALLSDLSQEFSVEINRLATTLGPLVERLRDHERYRDFFTRELHAHCPPVLVERYAERLHERIPAAHLGALLTKRLASRMLYREGLTWCRNYVTDDRAEEVLTAYLDAHENVRSLLTQLGDRTTLDPAFAEMLADGTRREIVRRQLGR